MWCGDCFERTKPYGTVNGGGHEPDPKFAMDRRPSREYSEWTEYQRPAHAFDQEQFFFHGLTDSTIIQITIAQQPILI